MNVTKKDNDGSFDACFNPFRFNISPIFQIDALTQLSDGCLLSLFLIYVTLT